MDSLDKMLTRLFLKPMALAGLGIGALFFLGVWVPLQLSTSPMLAPIGQMASNIALIVTGGLFLASLSMFIVRAWQLHQWHLGTGPFCHRCGGMVQEEIYRHHACHRCFSCNQRRYL
jgi:hypothetical protein